MSSAYSSWTNPFGKDVDPAATAPRVARAALSFAAIVCAYLFYSVALVPFIEPSIERPIEPPTTNSGSEDQSRLDEIRHLFPADAWQLQKPLMIENSQSIVLCEEYKNHPDGRLEVRPCTVIVRPSGEAADEAERRRRMIVIDVPEGATLQFSRPLQFGGGDMGRIIGGQLPGPVTIRSQGRSAGPEDDLLIKTQNIEMSDQRIWTRAAVEFRLGGSFGRGHELEMRLTDDKDGKTNSLGGPAIGGMESFELRRIEQLHIESNRPKTAAAARPAGSPAVGLADDDLPIELSCQGPFRFHMGRKRATFEDHVNVIRIHPNGPGDQLQADLLLIHFADRRESVPPGPDGVKPPVVGSPSLGDLEPRVLEALGEPAVLNAPSQKALGRAQRLEYDLKTGRIGASGNQPVYLRHGDQELTGMNIQAEGVGPGRLGNVAATGPGSFHGAMAEKPDQAIDAKWSQQLLIRPQDQNQVISLVGAAELSYAGFGRLSAEEIHFWVKNAPAAPAATAPSPPNNSPASQLVPDRMLALHQVVMNSDQFTGAVDHLEVWFEQASAAGESQRLRPLDELPRATPPQASLRNSPFPSSAWERTQAKLRFAEAELPSRDVPKQSLGTRGNLIPTSLRLLNDEAASVYGAAAAPSGAAASHFEITAKVMRAKLLLADRRAAPPVPQQQTQGAELAELSIEENVRLVETTTSKPGERPMVVTGDRLYAVEPMSNRGTVLVAGNPAHFEARGLGLTAAEINLNRGTNRIWADGVGRMDLPMDRDLEGRPTNRPGNLEIHWRNGMTFDGLKARFEDSVVVTAANARLETETLEVAFREKVSFAQPAPGTANAAQPAKQPEVEQINCRGGVTLESHRYNGQELIAIERMQMPDLSIQRTSGAVAANGPGQIHRFMRGTDQGFQMPGAKPAAAPAENDPGLRSLVVRWQGPMTGNIHRREVTFREDVQTAYAPVQDWNVIIDPAKPESLGPNGMTLSCNQLRVLEMPTPLEGRQAIELESLGNAVVESPRGFTARALRIAYSEGKEMLIAEGDGRTDAELYRQTQIGGAPTKIAARRIFFWPKTNTVRVDGARSVNLNQAPGLGK